MSLITKVKAGSISSLSDARYFAGMGVDWLGFDVNPASESYVSAELYKNMAGWVAGPKRVLEFSAPMSNESMQTIIAEYVPDFIQISLEQVSHTPLDKPTMATASLETLDTQLLTDVASRIQYLILNCRQPFEHQEKLVQASRHARILLVVEPDCLDIKKMVAELPMEGIALRGSKELKPGLKDYDYSNLLESLDDDA
jgi:phosphoribosylanthranilate isomerase